MAADSKHSGALTSPGYFVPFLAVAVLFFMFGFITNLNMGLVPDLKKIFEIQKLENWQAMLANGAFFTAYFVFSAPAGRLIEAIGYKRTMVVSLFIQVLGALLFLPAAQAVSFPLFLTAIFVVGAGVSTLQTAANPYVSILGPEDTAPIRLNLAQALNSLGGTIAPWIAGTFILTATVLDPAVVASESAAAQHAYQMSIANTVRMPYLIIAFGLVLLGLAVAFLHLPHIEATRQFRPGKEGDEVLKRSIWNYRHTVLVGRLLGSWMMTKIKAGRLLGIFGVTAAALVVISIVSPGYVAIGSLILAGFFNSVMFPNIFTLGIAGLGPMTSKGSGLIMTAVWGGALIPVAIGWCSDHFSYQLALVIPVVCYLYIAFYGFWGSKPTRTAEA